MKVRSEFVGLSLVVVAITSALFVTGCANGRCSYKCVAPLHIESPPFFAPDVPPYMERQRRVEVAPPAPPVPEEKIVPVPEPSFPRLKKEKEEKKEERKAEEQKPKFLQPIKVKIKPGDKIA